ncbi:MAG: hypothetical protein AB7L18_01640, partial [Hyphomicrobiaceae bacterium]
MVAVRSIVAAAAAFCGLTNLAAAQECEFSVHVGDRGGALNSVPFYWLLHVFQNDARASGVAAVSGFGSHTTADTYLEISRRDGAARKRKAYTSFVEVKYFAAPPPRKLKAKLEIGGSMLEFAIEEKAHSGNTRRIDLAPLYPSLIDAIRKGNLAHMTIFDGDKKFIEQYVGGPSMKVRFGWMEEEMERIFAAADAGKCNGSAPSKTPPPAPGGGG